MSKLEFNLPKKINKAIDMIYAGGFCCFAVGGCVRDLAMGKVPHDYDITTSALPEEVISIFDGKYEVKPTGIEHGTVTVYFDGEPLEITTFRKEGKYSDHRHPDEVTFTRNLEDDLVRRDFTMNALAFNEREGLTDLFGGLDDIESKTIRCIGEPEKRFTEDAIRIMRAVRFSSYLGFDLEEETAKAVKKLAPTLSYVSRERLNPELSKLLCGDNVVKTLLDYSDVIFEAIPELKPMYGCQQNSVYHNYDVWKHTVGVIANMPSDITGRFAALFHDSGKPKVKWTDKSGFDHFVGHVEASLEIANKVLDSFAYPSEMKEKIHFAILHHEEKIPISRKRMKMLMNCGDEEKLRLLFELQFADNQAKTINVGINRMDSFEASERLVQDIISKGECYTLKQLDIKGNELVSLGIKGKEIALTLDNLLLDVIAEKVLNEKNELLTAAEKIVEKIRENDSDYLINLREENSSFFLSYAKRFGEYEVK